MHVVCMHVGVCAVYIMCGLHAQMLPVCIMLYNVHACMVRVYGLCVCTVGCVYLVRVYYLHIVYIVCVHCLCEPRALYTCAVAESRTVGPKLTSPYP